MSDTSPVLSLPFILPSQAQKHVTHNEALEILDVLVQGAAQTRGLTAPPATPVTGERHIVGPGATGDWAGKGDAIALWLGPAQGWRFFLPRPGWRVFVLASGTETVWDGAGWRDLAGLDTVLDQLGINTGADTGNRLAVASAASLFTHAGAGHQMKINKANSGATASLLFQTGWSGRAEMGLAGTDAFEIKVSADGNTFRAALRTDASTGVVSLPAGVILGGPASGAGVQAHAADATAGRLLSVGAFGLGGAAPLVGNAGATTGALAPGFYSYDSASGSTDGPAGALTGLLIHLRASTSGETQMFQTLTGSGPGARPGLVFSRIRAGGAWGAWSLGDIAESGSNAQGHFRRHQDGTQTCWQNAMTQTGADVALTFPAAFASASGLVTSLGVVSGTGVATPRLGTRSATGLSLSAYDGSNSRVAVSVDLITFGRWY